MPDDRKQRWQQRVLEDARAHLASAAAVDANKMNTVYPTLRRVGLNVELTLPANTTTMFVLKLSAIPGFRKIDGYRAEFPFRHWAQVKHLLEEEFGTVDWKLDEPKVDPFAPIELFVEYVGACRSRVDRSVNVFGQQSVTCYACSGSGLSQAFRRGSSICRNCSGSGRATVQATTEAFASAWVDGGWTVRFPEKVLREFFPEKPKPFDGNFHKALLEAPDLSKAYKQLARQFHPDLNKSKDASAQFRKLREAFDALRDPMTRKRYEAGLKFQTQAVTKGEVVWRVPKQCGNVLVRRMWEEVDAAKVHPRQRFEGRTYRRFHVTKILDWQDVYDERGRVMCVKWNAGLSPDATDDPFGSDGDKPFSVSWADTSDFVINI